MLRLIPTRAAIIAAITAAIIAALSWLRMDARRDLRRDLQQQDTDNAKKITDRVGHNRTDPDRLRKYEGRGYRD